MQLSGLLGQRIMTRTEDLVGRVDDVIVRLGAADYPVVTGVVAKVGGRSIFVPVEQVADLSAAPLQLNRNKINMRGFERRSGEVLLRADILGHRLIDVAHAELVHAFDAELASDADGRWELHSLDTRRPARLFGLLGQGAGRPSVDWKAFEPLIGHTPTAVQRGGFGHLRRLKPAQIADLLEDASRGEGKEILAHVHVDPELEADVFEELDSDTATRLLTDKSDAEIAGVLARMRADDAADAVAELPQARRQPVLDALPAGHRAKVLTLLGFNPASAGGLMNVDAVSVQGTAHVADALVAVRGSQTLQPEALASVQVLDGERLVGVVPLVRLLQSDPNSSLTDVADGDPVRVGPEADVVDVALLMADYNLTTIPVVDPEDRLLGVVTVDDVLEATIPDDWRRREPPAHPHRSINEDATLSAGP